MEGRTSLEELWKDQDGGEGQETGAGGSQGGLSHSVTC